MLIQKNSVSPVQSSPDCRGRRVWLAALRLLCALAVPGLAVSAGDYPLEIIELRARLPEDLIPTLRPLAGPDGTLLGSGNQLFVRASPARLADIRRALIALDKPPRSLLIQVRQSGSNQSSGLGAGVGIDEPVGRDGRVRIGLPDPGGSQAGVWAGQDRASRSLSQEVRALDGRPAFIAVGTEQPMPYRERETGSRAGRGGTTVREGTYYRRAESGFYVIPRVVGDTVTLEVSAGTAQPDRRGGLATSAAGSQVRGRLGEWLPVGASVGSESRATVGVFHGARGERRAQGRIDLRVLPLD